MLTRLLAGSSQEGLALAGNLRCWPLWNRLSSSLQRLDHSQRRTEFHSIFRECSEALISRCTAGQHGQAFLQGNLVLNRFGVSGSLGRGQKGRSSRLERLLFTSRDRHGQRFQSSRDLQERSNFRLLSRVPFQAFFDCRPCLQIEETGVEDGLDFCHGYA